TRGRERHYRLVPDGTDPVRRFVRSIDPSRAPVTERALDALTTEVHRTRREVRRAARRETA
ncbi:MAG TPA: hypothetical protein PKB06_09345, partial [Actinotalea sp.]|nr:hypothetical protein [Actinotalea sp.]